MKVYVKNTKPEEAQVLSEIQKAAFAPLYEKYHDEGNPCLRGVEDIANRLNSEYYRYFTIFEEEKIVGGIFYKCKGTGLLHEPIREGEYYLQRIYISPQRQGKKIAQTAIKLCEAYLENAAVFTVDFPEDLTKNRMCYEAVGFKNTGKRLEVTTGLILAGYEKWISKDDTIN